ncbi:MAG: hypothetical protein RLY85_1, partial [Bacteroidota bacterium]
WGPLRGGKYSAFEAGTRVPFIISWPGGIKPGVSNAMISQIDLMASFAAFFKQAIPAGDAPDSENQLQAMLGKSQTGRKMMVKQGMQTLSITTGEWKYIEPGKGPANSGLTNIETGNNPLPQLYNLKADPGERNNLATQYPDQVNQLAGLLKKIRENKQ